MSSSDQVLITSPGCLVVRLMATWFALATINLMIMVADYRGADAIFGIVLVTGILASFSLFVAVACAGVFFIDPVRRWWRFDLFPAALVLIVGGLLITHAIMFAQSHQDVETGERVTELRATYLIGLPLVGFSLAYAPIWRRG